MSGHHEDHFAELTEELRLLAEMLLERVEPMLRRTALDGRVEWSGCSWCPVCAAAALVRGEHHDVVAALADHGTAVVTVLREALAGVPVEPVLPPDDDLDDAVPQRHSHLKGYTAGPGDGGSGPGAFHRGPSPGRRPRPDADSGLRRDDEAAAREDAGKDSRRSATTGRGRSGYVPISVSIKV